jgi:hypothetical protein
MYFGFRRVKSNSWAISMSIGDALPVLNEGGDGDVDEKEIMMETVIVRETEISDKIWR